MTAKKQVYLHRAYGLGWAEVLDPITRLRRPATSEELVKINRDYNEHLKHSFVETLHAHVPNKS